MYMRVILALSQVRRATLGLVLSRLPGVAAFARSVPVKTLALLSFTGTMSVVFATVPRITPYTFGACCGSVAALCALLALRVHGDEDVISTFSPIMSGTPRVKMRTLHGVLHFASVGFGFLGALVVVARRYEDELVAASGGPQAAPPPPLAPSQLACVAALAAVSLQLLKATPFDVDDPSHVALGLVAGDAVAVAQVSAVVGLGAPSLATALVAWSLGLLWASNAAQIHDLQDKGRSSAEADDAMISFEV